MRIRNRGELDHAPGIYRDYIFKTQMQNNCSDAVSRETRRGIMLSLTIETHISSILQVRAASRHFASDSVANTCTAWVLANMFWAPMRNDQRSNVYSVWSPTNRNLHLAGRGCDNRAPTPVALEPNN